MHKAGFTGTGNCRLVVTRRVSDRFGILARLAVCVDGSLVAKLRRGQHVALALESGEHRVHVRMAGFCSDPVQIRVAPGTVTRLSFGIERGTVYSAGLPSCIGIAAHWGLQLTPDRRAPRRRQTNPQEATRLATLADTRLSQNVFSGLQQENDDGLVEADDIATSHEN